MQLQPIIGENYNFMAQPKVLKPRAKFRDENNPSSIPQETQEEEDDNKNSYHLMWDRRVVRGNTYAAVVSKKNDQTQTKPKSPTKQTKSAIKIPKPLNESGRNQNDLHVRVETPKAIEGRIHAAVETEPFIEILTDKPPETEKEALTDFYIDRPMNRLFVYKKDGVDREQQILEGELFDFNTEVEPLLQVLLGKTLEQSRMEVLEEEELKAMKDQQKKFEQMRNAELAEMQRLEAKEARMLEEIEKRKLQYSKQKDQLIYSHQKLISRLCSKSLLKHIKPNCFNKLEDVGVFRNPLEFGLYDSYLPWLINNVADILLQKEDREDEFQNLLFKTQDEVRDTHYLALKRREQMKEDKKQEIIRKQIEKEENKRKRKEEKIRQAELKRIQEIKDKVQAKIFSKNELRQTLNALTISDIDNYERQFLFVGMFGGFVGEAVRFIEKIFEIAQIKQLAQITPEALEKVVNAILDSFLLKGSFEIEVDENSLKELLALDPLINIEFLHSANKVKHQEIAEILKRNLMGILANLVLSIPDLANLNIREKIIELIIKYSIEQEKGKNIKYVRNPTRSLDFTGKIALCRVNPRIDVLNVRPALLEYQQRLDPNFLPENFKLQDIWQAELEDKYTATVPLYDDVRVLILHQVAHINLRRNFINDLRVVLPDIKEIEFELEELLFKEDQIIIPEIVKKLNPEMLVFDFEMY